jgi:phosphoribosylanthranilate isomerase
LRAWLEYAVTTEVKFCGLARRVDAQLGARLGAGYLGVIFAGGPRQQTARSAIDVFTGCDPSARRVGVFGHQPVGEIAALADEVRLDILQLHGDAEPAFVAKLRAATTREIWSVLRMANAELPPRAADLIAMSDGVLLDSKVEGRLGGTGMALDWAALGDVVRRLRESTRVILAGGLTPANVARAIALAAPDIVDVSSGIEEAPGVKRPAAMRDFLQAVAQARVAT